MSEENKHMDESFRRMSKDYKVTYNKSFWNDVAAKLEDDSLDDAFRAAAAGATPLADVNLASESLSDAFMDDAFREAANAQSMAYDKSYWEEMDAMRNDLHMDEAFFSASKEVKANYNPVFWGDANVALEKEGLHYEYKSSYWAEARELLDKADRKIFFYKWTGIAVLLLLISVAGINWVDPTGDLIGESHKNTNGTELNNRFNTKALTLDAPENSIGNNIIAQNNTAYVANSEIEQVQENIQDLTGEIDPTEAIVTVETNEIITESVESFTNDVSYTAEDNVENENHEQTPVHLNENEAPILVVNEVEELSFTEEDFVAENELKKLEVRNNRILQEHVYPAFGDIETRDIPETKRKKVGMFSVLGLAGVGQNYGMSSVLPVQRYSLGLEYMNNGYGVLRNFEFGGSVMANNVKFDNFGAEQRRTLYLDNGDVERSWYKLYFLDAFYVNANFLVNYRISPQHKLKFGVGGERLLTTQSNMVSRTIEDDFKIVTVNNNWGILNGMTTFDARLSLGYEYMISPRLATQINGNFGLFDRTGDDFFNSPITDREMNIMVGLKYTLFRKV